MLEHDPGAGFRPTSIEDQPVLDEVETWSSDDPDLDYKGGRIVLQYLDDGDWTDIDEAIHVQLTFGGLADA